jgi:hypothetical protein
VSFYSGTQTELLYSLPAAVTKNTYTTQAVLSVPGSSTLPRCIVPGKFFSSVPSGIGRALWLHAEGTIANTAAATFTGVLGWDPTAGTLANSITYWPILAPTASTTCLWSLDAVYTCQQVGSAGLTLQVNVEYEQSVVASGVLSTAGQKVKTQTSLTGINAEVDAYIELWGTWSAASSSNTTVLQQMHLFGLN